MIAGIVRPLAELPAPIRSTHRCWALVVFCAALASGLTWCMASEPKTALAQVPFSASAPAVQARPWTPFVAGSDATQRSVQPSYGVWGRSSQVHQRDSPGAEAQRHHTPGLAVYPTPMVYGLVGLSALASAVLAGIAWRRRLRASKLCTESRTGHPYCYVTLSTGAVAKDLGHGWDDDELLGDMGDDSDDEDDEALRYQSSGVVRRSSRGVLSVGEHVLTPEEALRYAEGDVVDPQTLAQMKADDDALEEEMVRSCGGAVGMPRCYVAMEGVHWALFFGLNTSD